MRNFFILFFIFFAATAIAAEQTATVAGEKSFYRNPSDTIGYEPGVTFQVPRALHFAVEFWKIVYTRFTTKQNIIHDNKYLNVIYTSIDFTDLYANPSLSDREKAILREKKNEDVKNYYRALLRKLDRVDQEEISVGGLDPEEKRIYDLFVNIQESYRFDQAQSRIRSQVGQKEEFRRGIADSGAYLAEMEEIFRSYRVPVQLTRLPFVESMFNPKAYSKVHASGIWQFMPATGKIYLRINSLMDERNDPILSTHASARLLMTNYKAIQSWPLAITAYNHGLSSMKSAVRRVGDTDIGVIIEQYRKSSFGFASRNFYAQFLAALEVEANYEKYFGRINRAKPLEYETVRLPDHVALKTIAEYCRIPEQTLIDMNPGLTRLVTRGEALIPSHYDLRIPREHRADFFVSYANIPKGLREQILLVTQTHRVGSGETLSQIARKYRTTTGEILAANQIRSANRIHPGMKLMIPTRAVAAAKMKPRGKEFVMASRAPKAEIRYPEIKIQVLSGEEEPSTTDATEDLSDEENATSADSSAEMATPLLAEEVAPEIATAAVRDDSMASLFAAFDPENNEKTFSIQSAKSDQIPWTFHYEPSLDAPPHELFQGTTVVTDGETAWNLASWCKISTPQSRKQNNLKFGENLEMGQKLALSCTVTQAAFHQERKNFHAEVEKNFLKTCRGEIKTVTHHIKTGQNLWQIANDTYKIPIWFIQKYNPQKDFTQGVAVGDEIIIPQCNKIA